MTIIKHARHYTLPYSHRGKPSYHEIYDNQNGSRSASKNRCGSHGKYLALYFLRRRLFHQAGIKTNTSKPRKQFSLDHPNRPIQSDPILLLTSGMTVAAVILTFGPISYAGKAAFFFFKSNIFYLVIRPNHLRSKFESLHESRPPTTTSWCDTPHFNALWGYLLLCYKDWQYMRCSETPSSPWRRILFSWERLSEPNILSTGRREK